LRRNGSGGKRWALTEALMFAVDSEAASVFTALMNTWPQSPPSALCATCSAGFVVLKPEPIGRRGVGLSVE
jgi:hypothetical protein